MEKNCEELEKAILEAEAARDRIVKLEYSDSDIPSSTPAWLDNYGKAQAKWEYLVNEWRKCKGYYPLDFQLARHYKANE